MSGAGLRGVSAEQDGRFRNKELRLMKQMKFPEEYKTKVDLSRVNWDVMKPWIAKRVTELLGIEDDVLIGYIFGQLEGQKTIDPRKLQINLTGFLEKNTSLFCKELWTLLSSAALSSTGIPQKFLDEKAEELRLRREEDERIQARLRAEQAKRDEENRQANAARRDLEDSVHRLRREDDGGRFEERRRGDDDDGVSRHREKHSGRDRSRDRTSRRHHRSDSREDRHRHKKDRKSRRHSRSRSPRRRRLPDADRRSRREGSPEADRRSERDRSPEADRRSGRDRSPEADRRSGRDRSAEDLERHSPPPLPAAEAEDVPHSPSRARSASPTPPLPTEN
uniref:PWI domain-containing protein n=1 Tax=Auxenochlorella protothecoides TaxID=3075 RepID=A0A1D2A9M7_AUXPR